MTQPTLGRANFLIDPDTRKRFDPPGKVHLRRMYLTRGYDDGGAYWGTGDPLWWALCPETRAERYIRAASRTKAKRIINHMWPRATFFN